MSNVTHRFVESNGIRLHIAEQGTGPLVVLLHGFPESWYSWRHQLGALADAGYHAVAPDQRGYGQSDRPPEVERYTQLHLVGDVIGLLDALGEAQAVVVGHDFGAPVAWNTALLRPDRVRGVVGLSVPHLPRGPVSSLQALRTGLGEGFYQAYFQAPGVADAELARDVRRTVRSFLYSASGDAPNASEGRQPVIPPGRGILDILADPGTLPDWLTEADVEFYASEFARTGFTGGLNWYRNIDRSWELMAAWQGARVIAPALYVAGEHDLVVNFPRVRGMIEHLTAFAPNLRGTVLLPGCGHWAQQERPAEVNRALIEFVQSLPE